MDSLPIGTKSLLFGAHQVFIHPWFVAYGWFKLYGFPFDPRLWIAFIVHDWGYWGLPNMDGAEGERHPIWAADLMARWFGEEWGELVQRHSQFLAKADGVEVSKLCYADKLAICFEPWWLYLWRARTTGEVDEYRARVKDKFVHMQAYDMPTDREWFSSVQHYLRKWVRENYCKPE